MSPMEQQTKGQTRTPLITARALASLQGERDVLIVDCRFDLTDPKRSATEYAQAHIGNAVYAHLDSDLSDLSKQGLGRHPLPDAANFSASLRRWGWQSGTPIVAYDAAGGALAASRLWWMLRLCGVEDVAVLDGGWQAWQAAGLASSSLETPVCTSAIEIDYDASQMVGSDALSKMLPEILLVDARAAPRYRGEVEPLDRVAGHVPGAVNRPFQQNLDANGKFKPAAVLRDEFLALLTTHSPRDVVHMCGSGVTACHNLLAMEHAGLHGSRIYAPSWSGWIDDPSRIVEKS